MVLVSFLAPVPLFDLVAPDCVRGRGADFAGISPIGEEGYSCDVGGGVMGGTMLSEGVGVGEFALPFSKRSFRIS